MSDETPTLSPLFDLAVAVIFAREVLEAAVIVGSYRTIINKTSENEEDRKRALNIVNQSTVIATILALIVIVCVAIPLSLMSKYIDTRVVNIIEGVSKLIACIFIAQLSLKVPVWLQVYPKKKSFKLGTSLKEMRFNIMWNIWREVAECGAFLIPYFFSGQAKSIPLSGLAGIAIGFVMGLIIYYANKNMKDKFWLCLSMSFIFGLFAVGLLVSGCHKLEIVFGMTPIIWEIKDPFWSSNKFPMTLLKPFGYSSTRTILQCIAFWLGTFFMLLLHYIKYRKSHRLRRALEANETGSNEDTNDETNVSDSNENIEVVQDGSIQSDVRDDQEEITTGTEISSTII